MSGGQASTLGQGSVAALGITLALVGSAVTTGQGFITGGSRGQVITLSQGTLTPVFSGGAALTGGASTTAAGTLTAQGQQPALTGQGITGGQGTLSPGGPPLTVNITGSEVTFAAGFVQGGFQFLSGIAITGSQGTPVLSRTMALIGVESVSAQGMVGLDQQADDTRIVSDLGSIATWSADVALIGAAVTTAQGTLSVTGDSSAVLAGQAATSAAGSFGFEQAYPLTGSEITSAQQTVGAPGGATLTGSESVVSGGTVHTTTDRDFALTGQSVTVADGSILAGFRVDSSGLEIASALQSIGPRDVALVGLVITVRQGEVAPPDVRPPGGGGGHKPPHKPPKGPPPRGHGKHRIKEAEITGDVLEAPGVPLEDGEKLPASHPVFPPVQDDDEDEAFLLL